MSEIKYIRSKKSTNTGSIFGALVIYSLVALEVLIGDLPSKSGGVSSTFYEKNVGFFWILVSVQIGYGLYLLIGSIRSRRRLRKIIQNGGENGISEIGKILNVVTIISAFLVGFCFLILPLVEMFKSTIYGGLIFKNHGLVAEPEVFWQLWFFHLFIAFLPILCGVLLVIFAPKKIQSTRNELNYYGQH